MDNHPRSPRWLYSLLRGSLMILPYLSYVGIAGLLGITFGLLARFKRTALDPVVHWGLMTIAGLMLWSCLFAVNRAEAFLQLANYLPFFLMFSVVPFLLYSLKRLEQLATDLVIVAIPINGLALIEYVLRADFIPKAIRQIPIVDAIRDKPHAGRASVMFNHPNALASYLVLILGLGLGLVLYRAIDRRSDSAAAPRPQRLTSLLIYLGTYANLVGIFCSGSRNGLVVAVCQIVLFSLLWGIFTRVNRAVLLTSLVSLGGILVGAAGFGIGGRSLSPGTWADDPRLRIWTIAIHLIQARPWWGWGLGNYKFEFPSQLLAFYPSCLAVRDQRVVPVECADVMHSHNFWLTMASEAGLLVTIALTVWVGYLCFRSVQLLISKQLKPENSALLLGFLLALVGCIAFALFDVTLYDARVNVLNWIVLAGLYATTRNVRQNSPVEHHP